jgi:hypothetical protein
MDGAEAFIETIPTGRTHHFPSPLRKLLRCLGLALVRLAGPLHRRFVWVAVGVLFNVDVLWGMGE